MKLALACVLAACSGATDAKPPIRFLHTFGPGETEVLNQAIVDRGLTVESSLVPFARGHQVIEEILRAGTSCPDLVRIDATWLPSLVAAELVLPTPPRLAGLDWLPEAAVLAGAPMMGVPQTVDGLVVVRRTDTPPPASPSLADLIAAARAARTAKVPYPLGIRVDGYWVVPWLRAEGSELAPGPAIEGDGATRALAGFAALFGDVAAPPPSAGSEAPDELRRWNAQDLKYWVTGPWQLGGLRDRDQIAASALAHAPRGGQLLVVPRCAKRPLDGWRLAEELTSPKVGLIFSDAFATVPTRRVALDGATPLVHALYDALRGAELLPRSQLTPLLFDDLNPAVAAVVAGDATAEEAVAGVRRGWRRLEATP